MAPPKAASLTSIHDPYGELVGATATLLERFWKKVQKQTECWIWVGSLSSNGYGQIRKGGKGTRVIVASRLSLIIHGSPAPLDMEACHSCDTPACVRPDHLFVGTHDDNMKDSQIKGRLNGPRWINGSRPGVTILKDEDIPLIISLRLEGKTYLDIGKAFNVSADTIGLICRRKAWKHIDIAGPPIIVRPSKKFCPNGHPYSTENTYVNGRGYKECRTCSNTKHMARYWRKKNG